MADRSGPTEQAIFLFQSMMLEDEGFMNEVKFQIKAGISAAEAMYRAGNRYAEQLAAMETTPTCSCAVRIFWMPPAAW